MFWLDQLVYELLAPLAVWVFANGLDDLFLDAAYAVLWLRARRERRSDRELVELARPRVAIVIPCWREADVIAEMLERNLSSIFYDRYDIWVGLYPNDPDSIAKVDACRRRGRRIRRVLHPRPGPTTKADCLNQIFRGIFEYEARSGERYEVFLQHDAEDVIHPLALLEAGRLSREFDMVQFPVFPLAAPLRRITHGVYGDEFAEGHLRDLPVRSRLGGFIPSAGVGTALRRSAVDRLRASLGDELFDAQSLTEDYCLGLEGDRLGFRQVFWAPLRLPSRRLTATRSLFPMKLAAAVRQRTRWIIGNNLQAWRRFGWTPDWKQWYWLWRDRKGLLNHPGALVVNLLFVYGAFQGWRAAETGTPWARAEAVGQNGTLLWLLAVNTGLLVWRQGVRAWSAGRIYGSVYAWTVPLRAPWANLINSIAGLRAAWIYASAQLRGRPLKWSKTEHEYPPDPSRIDLAPSESSALALLGQDGSGFEAAPIALEDGGVLLAGPKLPGAELLEELERRHGCRFRFVQVAPEEYVRLRRYGPRERTAATGGR